MAENKAPEAEKPKKGKLKLIILLVVVVLLAIGLSVAGTLWFLGNGGAGGETAESEAQDPAFVPSQYLVLEKSLTTTVPAEDRQRYAQIYVALEARDPQALAAAELHMPLLRSRLIGTISNSQFQELRKPEGRKQLASDMRDAVNQALEAEGGAPVEAVLLRNFVLQ